jgi:glucose-6-phosphate 1-epimerase
MSASQTRDEIQAICAGTKAVTVIERDGGLVLEVAAVCGLASIALQGAHLLSWVPTGHSDVLWCSQLSQLGGGKAIRGGIPICWPWFGPHATDPNQPQHGFARTTVWSLARVSGSDTAVSLVFDLPHAAARTAGVPGDVDVSVHFNFGLDLDIRLVTHNRGAAPLTVSAALHTYFRVGDVAQIVIDGLDGATYRDNTDAGRQRQQIGPRRIMAETIALFDHAAETQTLTDPLLQRQITISRRSGASTVVWNPGANAKTMADISSGAETQFVCIESGDIGVAACTVQPGELHAIHVVYKVTPKVMTTS